jgi:hypothetical protein
MRESIGGAFLIKIMVVFIVLYNSLLAIAVNYAMAFRVKNSIINILEQNEGCRNTETQLSDYKANVRYYRPANKDEIVPVQVDRGYYYKVTTYISFDFPVVGDLFTVPVTGETKVIYDPDKSNMECS